jgi:DNA invertase Pin-like site-specific DNA recombinase
MNYFSYARISTKEKEDKQSFARQEQAFQRYEKENEIEFLRNFKDDCSGSTFDRHEWKQLESAVHTGDTIVFKDVSRFTRQAEVGLKKYMDLMKAGVNLIFIDNPTISTGYIKQLGIIAESQDLIIRKSIENVIELLLIVELDRVEKERQILIQRIKQGIQASNKKQGRKPGQLDKMSDELETDIKKYLSDRSVKQIDIMKKHNISRNTLKKYIEIVQNEN